MAIVAARIWLMVRQLRDWNKQQFGERGTELIQMSPYGPPRADGSDLIERTRQSLGARVERALSNLAYAARSVGQEQFSLLTPEGRVTEPVETGLLRNLPIAEKRHAEASALLVGLMRELQTTGLNGEWGRSSNETGGLVLKLERLPLPPEGRWTLGNKFLERGIYREKRTRRNEASQSAEEKEVRRKETEPEDQR